MPDIKLNLVNQALSAIGEDTVSSLTGGDVCCRAANEHYEDIVAEELERNRPIFATKTAASMTLLTPLRDKPLQYQWQLPSDFLVVSSALYLGVVMAGERYEIEGKILRSYYNSDMTLRYIWRAPEEMWTSRFKRIVEQRLEALFLRVTERFTQADQRDKNTEFKASVARHTDSGQRSGRPLSGGSIVEARQGFRRRRG